jgi:FAD/FMN-containing dehydrogenase
MSVCPLIASTIAAAKAEFGESALAAMRSLKRALDPLDILNSEKIVSLG